MRNFSFTPVMAGKGVDILFYGDIGDEFDGITAKAFAEQLKQFGNVSEIRMFMNSIGGDAYEGAAIHNVLMRHKARVIIDIDGASLSAASLVAMAGDEIRMAENAVMMIHEPWGIHAGNADEMRAYGERLDKLSGVYADTYSKRTGVEHGEVLSMMRAETWMTAVEAMDLGFATGVIESKRVAARAVPEGRFKKTPPSLVVKENASTKLYREKLKQLSGKE